MSGIIDQIRSCLSFGEIIGVMLIGSFVLLMFGNGISGLKDGRFGSNEKRGLLLPVYCIVLSILLICPFTAFIIDKGRAIFTHFNYLWAAVPILPMTAVFLTEIFSWELKFFSGVRRSVRILTTVLILFVLLLCGNLGVYSYDDDGHPGTCHETTLEEMTGAFDFLISKNETTPLLILAPSDFTEYLHLYTGELKTLYGRDLWDSSFDVYCYDEYPEEYTELYEWMSGNENLSLPDYSADAQKSAKEYACEAQAYGVNCLVFYCDDLTDETAIGRFSEFSGEIGGNLTEIFLNGSETSGYCIVVY